jgi:hypothetical protein
MAADSEIQTVIVLGEGGGFQEMDIPINASRRELFDQQVATGRLVVVDPSEVEWIEEVYGADKDGHPLKQRRLVRKAAKPTKAAAAKAAAETEKG